MRTTGCLGGVGVPQDHRGRGEHGVAVEPHGGFRGRTRTHAPPLSQKGFKPAAAPRYRAVRPRYSTTLSTRNMIDCGTVRSSALAALAFKIVSNLVGT